MTLPDRDWAEADYVRVYQTVRDDPKFKTIYHDDRAFAAYVRLLMDADPVYPRRASIPAHLSSYARRVLTAAGVLQVEGPTYTLSGLAKEREGRKARYGKDGTGRPRYQSDSTPTPLREGSEPVDETTTTSDLARAGASASVSYSEFSSSEGGAGGNQKPPLMEAIAYVEERTRRPWVFGPGSKVWDALEPDVRDFGWPAVKTAMEGEKAPFPDAAQLVFGAARRLHPISGPEKQADPDPEYVKRAVAAQRKAKNGA
jgi:hypothetical protein